MNSTGLNTIPLKIPLNTNKYALFFQTGKLNEAIDSLLSLEKQTRTVRK